jgi:hypothetical protein
LVTGAKKHTRKVNLVNHLHGIWLDEYKRLSSVHYYKETNIDCYFNDDLIENTLTHLKKSLDKLSYLIWKYLYKRI